MKLNFGWLKGGKALAETGELLDQAKGLLQNLESLRGGILPDHAVEEISGHLKEHMQAFEGLLEKLPEGELKQKAQEVFDQLMHLTAPSPSGDQQVSLKEVRQEPSNLPGWLHQLNELACSSQGAPMLNKLVEFLKGFVK